MAPRQRDAASIDALLRDFQYQRHSLRVSVSNLAALVGLHPYKQVPELVQQLVYQGSLGQLLLQRDVELLGLSLVSPEEQLMRIAQKAGVATQQALTAALTKTSDSVEAARVLKETVVQQAKQTGRLQATELKVLQEGVRSAVDTKHGTRHEDAALDAYERQTGWPVRERNAQVKTWAFRAANKGSTLTVEPMGDATCLYRNLPKDESANDGSAVSDTPEDECSETDQASKRPKIIDLTRDDDGDEEEEEIPSSAAEGTVNASSDDPPFLCLLGSIDGLRDELAPNASMNDDDDSWILRPIVVECKHRMNRIHKIPPLYEQIQTVAYCFMNKTDHADILQVMRHDVTRMERKVPVSTSEQGTTSKCTTPTKAKAKGSCDDTSSRQRLLTECFATATSESSDLHESEAFIAAQTISSDGKQETEVHIELHQTESICSGHSSEPPVKSALMERRSSTVAAEKENAGLLETINDTAVPSSGSEPSEITQANVEPLTERDSLTISVSRVSLDDPIFQHRMQWHDVVLPRLRYIVDAVYRIRSDDSKRYRLLASMASADGTITPAAWQVVFDECPWIMHCDTAYSWSTTTKI